MVCTRRCFIECSVCFYILLYRNELHNCPVNSKNAQYSTSNEFCDDCNNVLLVDRENYEKKTDITWENHARNYQFASLTDLNISLRSTLVRLINSTILNEWNFSNYAKKNNLNKRDYPKETEHRLIGISDHIKTFFVLGLMIKNPTILNSSEKDVIAKRHEGMMEKVYFAIEQPMNTKFIDGIIITKNNDN